MAYNPLKPANDDFLAAFPPEMREQLRAMINDQIVDALKLVGLSPGNASGNIPISNGTVNVNLNADKLDGQDATAFAASGHGHTAATTSTNGFMSNTDKSKLDNIAAGAEVNQNAFSNVVVGGTTIQADGKTDSLELAAGSKITLTPDAANDRVTITFSGVADSDVSAEAQGALATGTVRSQLGLLDTTQRTAKTTPVDADLIGLNDSAASNALKKITWANIKATLKTYFDFLYAGLGGATFTGQVSVPSTLTVRKEGAEGGQIVLETGTNSTLGGHIIFDQAGDIVRIFENGGLFRGAGLPISFQASSASSEILTNTRLMAVLTGLDGTGSGLDADKLDGRHGSDFAYSESSGATDFNNIIQSGMYRINRNANRPAGTEDGQLVVVHGAGDTIMQIASDYTSSAIYWRSGNPATVGGPGAWGAWQRLMSTNMAILSAYGAGASQFSLLTASGVSLTIKTGKITYAGDVIGIVSIGALFPAAFPVECISAFVSPAERSLAESVGWGVAAYDRYGITMEVRELSSWAQTSQSANWFAIGY